MVESAGPRVPVPHSSRGPGHRPLKAEITGSNPVCGTSSHPDARPTPVSGPCNIDGPLDDPQCDPLLCWHRFDKQRWRVLVSSGREVHPKFAAGGQTRFPPVPPDDCESDVQQDRIRRVDNRTRLEPGRRTLDPRTARRANSSELLARTVTRSDSSMRGTFGCQFGGRRVRSTAGPPSYAPVMVCPTP